MDFQDVVNELKNGQLKTGLAPFKRKMWPRFAYHFTDINNAVSVLKDRRLFSRKYALENGLMKNDNASRDVISQTHDDVESYVRLYFRPRTPTQFYNEGFQVKSKRQKLHADCPIPVFFVFKLPELLSQPGVQFTDRSLALNEDVPRYHTPQEFRKLPFEDIYQEGPLIGMSTSQKKIITGHKQAEVIVPNVLDLDCLRVILVRSTAEKETLINLLHHENVYDYDQMIQIQREDYFFMNRNFIEDVDLFADHLQVKSNVNEAYPKEWGLPSHGFAVNKDATENYLNVTMQVLLPNGKYYWWPSRSVRALLLDKIELTLPNALEGYTLIIKIDGHIAYEGNYEQNLEDIDMPF